MAKITKISPFAPEEYAKLPAIEGFTMATAEAGIRYKGRTDLWLLRAVPGTSVAGAFTKNKCPGAPVDWSRTALRTDRGDAPVLCLVNSGTANVFSGQAGRDAVVETAEGIAEVLGGAAEAVFLSSTGVIGVPLKAEKITAKLNGLKKALDGDGWADAAKAIMTTDTYPKMATRSVKVDGAVVTINGIAKGSGMIAPDMATMLAYIATDAAIAQDVLQELLSRLVKPSFNSITVDSDTSTSDTVLLMASGKAPHRIVMDIADPALEDFTAALANLMTDLALQIVKDGEGASKFVTVKVSGAVSDESAHKIGLSIANSPLVKTAIAGEDANWGRIVMAVGKTGEPAERDSLTVHMGPHLLAEKGQPAESYKEEDGTAYMKNAELELSVDLGLGEGAATVYTCDLTHGYIDINADYRS